MSLCIYFITINVVSCIVACILMVRLYLRQKRVNEHKMLADSDDPESEHHTLREQACKPSSSEFWIIQALCICIFGLIGSIAVCNRPEYIIFYNQTSLFDNITATRAKNE